MPSYQTLDNLGTMSQSFHFEVTKGKRGPGCSKARASNCVCNVGKYNDTPGGCFQRSEDCPELHRYCCPKGTIGRPKLTSNGYMFEWTNPVRDAAYGQSNIKGPCFEKDSIKWDWDCKMSENARPPVF